MWSLAYSTSPCECYMYNLEKPVQDGTCKWQWDTTDSFPMSIPASIIEFTTTVDWSTSAGFPWLFCSNKNRKQKEEETYFTEFSINLLFTLQSSLFMSTLYFASLLSIIMKKPHEKNGKRIFKLIFFLNTSLSCFKRRSLHNMLYMYLSNDHTLSNAPQPITFWVCQ